MMRNITVIVLFAVLMTVSAVQLCLLKKTTERLTELIAECEQSIKEDSIDDKALSALEAYWDEYYSAVSLLTRSEELSEMAADVSRLGTLADGSELRGELEALRTRVRLICDEQIPHPRSVF